MPLSTMPETLIAGDSLALALPVGEYPAAAGWAVSLTLTPIAGGTPLTIPAADGVNAWEVAVTSAASGGLEAGAHHYLIAATKAGERSSISYGQIVVLPNPAAPGVDLRSAAQRALDVIDAVLEGRAGSADLEFTFEDGRSIKKVPHGDLIALRKFYARRVSAEKQGRRGPARINMRL